ncbi:DUF932 domain-containing protein [Brucella anthropi]|uniref:DUF932 domain-containing protein n=1 Tax=Brucella anthropi (strain ATCC 49188 / DSM 6882 / CCUG 24695 / JCM 21032 / LMG 3331 / NBRC 15819 / NCTC 12168 / Alc 37) TaxID=439375 RepID=A6WZ56_BRUA4|nr:DUF932 domain-containing protein [Brucella anthropi]ABS14260.1 conserved hypothetical protein [Brucella anthropi ATCC 49188]QQC25791.1 DUF932 domain-containing protein [Brucella anthropi]SUA65418.1 Uncharacterised protein [Brucella anthropi]
MDAITTVEARATNTANNSFKVGNLDKGEVRTDLQKQWIARPHDQRFLSLTDLHTSVKARADRTTEIRIDTSKIEFVAPEPKTKEDLSRLSLGLPTGETVAPTHWSFGQLASLAQAPAGYLRKLPSQIVADALTYGLRYNRSNEAVKLYDTTDELLAATGPDYGRIYDAEVVEAVQQIAGNGTGDFRWKVPGVLDWNTMRYNPESPVTLDTTTLYASDRDVFIFLVDDRNPIEIGKLPSGDPDLVFRGFYITNSEVGSSALKVAAFYLRAVCCNRLMWGVEGFQEISMRHSKYAPSRFIEEARPALEGFADGSTQRLLDGVKKARATKVASNDEEMIEFLRGRKFSQKQAITILEYVEKEEGAPARTIWDVAQGISASARNIPHTDDRVEFEREARRLLDQVA